jgi:hypothetical protein
MPKYSFLVNYYLGGGLTLAGAFFNAAGQMG